MQKSWKWCKAATVAIMGATIGSALTSLAAQAEAPAPAPPAAARKAGPDARAEALLQRMTRAEKLSLVFGYFGPNGDGSNAYYLFLGRTF